VGARAAEAPGAAGGGGGWACTCIGVVGADGGPSSLAIGGSGSPVGVACAGCVSDGVVLAWDMRGAPGRPWLMSSRVGISAYPKKVHESAMGPSEGLPNVEVCLAYPLGVRTS